MSSKTQPIPLPILILTTAMMVLFFLNGGMKTAINSAFMLLLLHLFIQSNPTRKELDSTFVKIVLLFGCWFLLSTFTAINSRVSLHQLVSVLSGILIIFITRKHFKGDTLSTSLKHLVLILHVYVIAAIIHYLALDASDFYFADFGRKLFFTLGHYNHFGTLLLLLIPIPFLFKQGQPILWAWSFFLFLLIFLTGSRSAMGAALIEYLLLIQWMTPRYNRRKMFVALILVLALFLGTATLIIPELQQKFTSGFLQLKTHDNRGRDTIWKGALIISGKYPFLGAGPGNYPVIIPSIIQGQILDAHNLFLNFLCEIGVPGLLLFLLLIYFSVGTKKALSDKNQRIYTILRIAILGVLIQNMATSSLLRCGALSSLFFFYLAICSNLTSLNSSPQTQHCSFLKYAMNGLLLTIVLFFVHLPLFRATTPYLFTLITVLAFIISFHISRRQEQLSFSNFQQPLRYRLIALCALLLVFTLSLRLQRAEGYNWQGILAERNFDFAQATTHFNNALTTDPANAVTRLNLLTMKRKSLPTNPSTKSIPTPLHLNSVIASLLPFDPIRLSNAAEESTQNNSTKTSSLEKLSHVESFGSAEQQLGELTSQPSLLVTSIEKNPAMAFTPYSLALLTNNPELTESILGQINLATVNNRTTRTWLLADYCLLAGEFEKAKELYQSSPEYSWFKQLNFTNQKDLLTSLTSILEELVQQSTIDKKPEQHLYYHSLLTYLRGGTLEFLPPPNKQDIRDHCNHLWIHFLFAHQEKTKLLVVRVNQLAAERYPAPFHFTHMAQLVKNTRIRNRQHTPATPVWMDDNFIFEPIRTDSLPLLAYLARNGIQSGGELGRHWAHLYSSIPEIRGQH